VTRVRSRRRGTVIALAVAAWGVAATAAILWVAGELQDRGDATRISPRYEPPVMAGQLVISACSGGFYARDGQTIVVTLSAHCTTPGQRLRDRDGKLIGVVGPRATMADCPEGRTCMPSDFVALALAPDRIPWGHLNVIDMGAGGYRELPAGARALACVDIAVGDEAETDGRERYRTGNVLAKGRYEHATDTIFPCIVVADIGVGIGDSGGAVLVGGLPAGVVSREMGDRLGFTPLAEGLETLELTLCTTPDCDLSPETAVQPSDGASD
jgi:hypothetical protein